MQVLTMQAKWNYFKGYASFWLLLSSRRTEKPWHFICSNWSAGKNKWSPLFIGVISYQQVFTKAEIFSSKWRLTFLVWNTWKLLRSDPEISRHGTKVYQPLQLQRLSRVFITEIIYSNIHHSDWKQGSPWLELTAEV